MDSFSYLEPVCCSMSKSNCCFKFLCLCSLGYWSVVFLWFLYLVLMSRYCNSGGTGAWPLACVAMVSMVAVFLGSVCRTRPPVCLLVPFPGAVAKQGLPSRALRRGTGREGCSSIRHMESCTHIFLLRWVWAVSGSRVGARTGRPADWQRWRCCVWPWTRETLCWCERPVEDAVAGTLWPAHDLTHVNNCRNKGSDTKNSVTTQHTPPSPCL